MDWFPALTTTSLLAIVAWLCRNLIATRLVRTVQHEFDERIEAVRSELRRNEEAFRAGLDRRASEIEALRQGALSNIPARQAALQKRRIEAVEQLWASAASLGTTRILAGYLSALNVKAMTEAVKRQERAAELLDLVAAGFDQKSIDYASATKARPFVSPMAWAIYSAMQAVAGHTMIRWHAMKNGMESTGLMDEAKVKELIKVALPPYSSYLETHGGVVFHYTLEALEAQLLAELKRMLDGAEEDLASVERAALIVRQSGEVMKANAASAAAA